MALQNLATKLKEDENKSGEATYKKLLADLDAVYKGKDGWQEYVSKGGLTGTKGIKYDTAESFWTESYNEIKNESKKAVKSSKSAKTKEILGDLQALVKDLSVTTGISASLASGIQEMISAVQPYIEQRIEVLKKSEGIITSMKKNAINTCQSIYHLFPDLTVLIGSSAMCYILQYRVIKL